MQQLFRATLLLTLLSGVSLRAQELAQPVETRLPKFILQTGIAIQWFDQTYKSCVVAAEMPTTGFISLGAQANFFFPSPNEFSDSGTEFIKGFEVGGYMKYFLHGKLSGRRSGLYVGPDLRWGIRKFETSFINTFPPPPNIEPVPYEEKSIKVLLRWGIQWQFGHATLDVSAPFGLERYKDNFPDGDPSQESQAVMLPTLLFGYAF